MFVWLVPHGYDIAGTVGIVAINFILDGIIGGVGAVLGLALMFFGGGFLRIFTPDPEVIAAGMEKLHIMGWSYAFSAFMDNSLAASRGLGKSAVPVAIVILGSCVFRVIWVYTIFACFHTIPALYLLYPCSWALTGFAEIIYFIHCYKQSMKIFNQQPVTA